MNLLRANYEEVLLHLGHAYQAMQRLMDVSSDWTAKADIEEEFGSLRDVCQDFVRHQYGFPEEAHSQIVRR